MRHLSACCGVEDDRISSRLRPPLSGCDFAGELLVSGDNVVIDGQATGTARGNDLACTAEATVLHVTGNNAIVQGIKFSCGSANRGVRFGAGVTDVIVRDCIFESDGNLASSPERA